VGGGTYWRGMAAVIVVAVVVVVVVVVAVGFGVEEGGAVEAVKR